MYIVKTCYEDGTIADFEDIDKIGYWDAANNFHVLCDEELENYPFPPEYSYFLFSLSTHHYTGISGRNLRRIEILKK